MNMLGRHWRALALSAAALSLVGLACSSLPYSYQEIEVNISRGNYAEAADGVKKNIDHYGDKSQVLYHLDLGSLYHYADLADSSTPHFFAAEKLIEEYYTKSISLAATSMLLNDNVLPYEGEDFEKALVNVFLALNYAERGEGDEALVEARKVDLKLREYSKQYEGKNRYQEDAFIRYVAGVLYESNGELNDAFISYRKSYETYKVYEQHYGTRAPSFLLDDLVRTATLMGFTEEAADFKKAGGKAYDRKSPPFGSVVVIAYVGKGPIKQEVRPTVRIPDAEGTIHTFQVALPTFVPRHTTVRHYAVNARPAVGSGNKTSATAELAENVTAIAAKDLEDRLSLIYLKSGGRALLKFLAAEKAKAELKKNKDEAVNIFGSLGIDLLVAATEQADLRTWRTLPAEFHLARLNLEPGAYHLTIRASDGGYAVTDEPVTVLRGKTVFVVVDDLR